MSDWRGRVGTGSLLLAAAMVAGGVAFLAPDAAVRLVPAGVGLFWTVALAWFARRLRGRARQGVRSLRSGAIACGLLTLVAVSAGLRGRVGWPELLLLVPAVVALALWARATVQDVRLHRRLPPAPRGPVLGLGGQEPREPEVWE